ncbi:MAG: glycoside hydrolase family 18 protein [Anaerolineae bacterium]|nr:glycoside hydrolase family 18 protein [Anaerolineae bacterium]
MMTRRLPLLLILALSLIGFKVAAESESPQHIIAYFSSWSIYERQYFVTDIGADMLTDINYAFANISDAGECAIGDEWADTQFPYPGEKAGDGLLGNFHQLQLLKEQNPNLQTLISIGGWTWSAKFSDVALTDASRKKFATSCVAFMKKYGFDGLDIDWEYPTGGGNTGNIERAEDPANFILLLTELRTELDAQGGIDGEHYLLTMAAGSNIKAISQVDWKAAADQLDWINVMAYDFVGSWVSNTGFNAPLYASPNDPDQQNNDDTVLKAYLAAGVASDKLVLGVPFYGRGWKDVTDKSDGLFQPYGQIPNGTYGEGVFEFSDLSKFWLPLMERHWDDTAKVPWLYNAKTGMMISYDDPESLKYKVDYVKDNNLGGVMVWELSSDSRDHTLLKAVHDALIPSE